MFKRTVIRALATTAAGVVFVVPLAAGGAGARGNEFRSTPDHGPAGTSISVGTGDPCKPDPGASDWTALVSLERDGRILGHRNYRVSPTGEWAGSISVPAGVEPGTIVVTALCFDSRHVVRSELIYEDRKFEVTKPEPAEPTDRPRATDPEPTDRPRVTDPEPKQPKPVTRPRTTPKATPHPGTPRLTG